MIDFLGLTNSKIELIPLCTFKQIHHTGKISWEAAQVANIRHLNAMTYLLDQDADISLMVGRSSNSDSSSTSGEFIAHEVVHLTTETFFDLMLLAKNATTPTVFDLCKRHLHYNGRSNTSLTASNITLRDGTFHLTQRPTRNVAGICVQGQRVKLEGITIWGGEIGVWIAPGGDASLHNCDVHCAHTGVWVGYTGIHNGLHTASQLSAVKLTIYDACGKESAVRVGAGGLAIITDSKISGGNGHGLLVSGNPPVMSLASTSGCLGMRGGWWAKADKCARARVILIRCLLEDFAGESVVVQGEGSKARLVDCKVDRKCIPSASYSSSPNTDERKGLMSALRCFW